MILFAILLCITIIAAVITLFTAVVAGGSILVIFGDLIVFFAIVWGIVKLIDKIKKKKS